MSTTSSTSTRLSATTIPPLTIPLINFSHFLSGTPLQRQQTASSILRGFQTSGFIYLSHIPITPPTVAHTFATSAKFFDRPQATKEALGWTTPESNRGYVTHGREKVSQLATAEEVARLKAQVPDLKESFEIGREGEEGRPNRWPDVVLRDGNGSGGGAAHGGVADGKLEDDQSAVEFREVMTDFFEQCKDLHVEVMRAIAVGMGLSESYFDGYTDAGDNTLRLLHYPPVSRSVFLANKLQVRAGEHTDYGTITLLFQDDRGGLQVQSPDGTFVDATPIPETVVINAGDLLARWSNDTIRSTMHRVVEPPLKDSAGVIAEADVHPARYSIAYFCNPNFDSYIEAIDGTYEKVEDKKYPGINSAQYITQRLAATY